MTSDKTFDPKMCASHLLNHLADAVGDVASAILEYPDDDDKWSKKIKAAKKNRVQDLHGWLADELYNDPDTITDLLGDKLGEECNWDPKRQLAVIEHLETGYAGLKKACKTLRSYIKKESN